MLSVKWTDMCTMCAAADGLRGQLPDRLEVAGRIGYLIACRKRQQYAKLCEADLEKQ